MTRAHPDDERAAGEFLRRFGIAPRWAIFAPGRVNLIGEHTDYQEGFVLPAAVAQGVTIRATSSPDRHAEVHSEALAATDEFDCDHPEKTGSWGDYVRGVVSEFHRLTGRSPGFRALVSGDLPPGSGLSSSAALAVGACLTLEAITGVSLDTRERAELAHRAENAFVGVPSGIMDPFACAMCREGSAMLVDCRTREVSHRTVPPELGRWVVVHSGIPRGLRDSFYARRREECERAVKAARTRLPGIRTLRDLDEARLPLLESLADAVSFRRARHVVGENARVGRMLDALEAGDRTRAGELLLESHRSLRDDFEVSLPELDAVVRISAEEGSLGGRLMGAGFGGCTIHLVPPEAGQDWERRVSSRYRRLCGIEPCVYPVRLSRSAYAREL